MLAQKKKKTVKISQQKLANNVGVRIRFFFDFEEKRLTTNFVGWPISSVGYISLPMAKLKPTFFNFLWSFLF